MKFFKSSILASIATLAFSTLTSGLQIIESNSLNPCQAKSGFTATLFNVAFTPENNSISVNINGVSSISGNVTAQLQVIAYGFTIINRTLDPCSLGLSGLCPMNTGQIDIVSDITVPSSIQSNIPGIAYAVPDLDGVVQVKVFSATDGTQVACMEADISNERTVYQLGVAWATAVIAGLGLLASGITSGLGNVNTAAHVAAYAISLFMFFQAQAVIGMTSVQMPPIVQSWTQNFQWSMGIIKVSFLQSICTWYQRATGGTPSTLLSTLSLYSVEVQKKLKRFAVKRSFDTMLSVATNGIRAFSKRDTTTSTTTDQVKVVRGIERVGFRAGIETTNIFMTSLIFFVFIIVVVALLVALAKGIMELIAKSGGMKSEKFGEFRKGWKIVIKGILFRLVLLGFVQISILCLWELTERDSAAEIVLAIVAFLSVTACLGWASFRVIRLAKKSLAMHKSAAYILYSDPKALNKWGFLYVQYKASAYYFVVPYLGYLLVKSIFIAFAQSSPAAQAIGLVIVETSALIAMSVLKPFMDKKTNIFNIVIAAVNFVNAIFLLMFSNVFGQPPMVSGVMGVLFAIYNILFCLVLLIMVLVASVYSIVSKNPETRYAPMRDDRGSFIKSQSGLNTELDALGATARGDVKSPFENKDDSRDSLSSDSLHKGTPEITKEKDITATATQVSSTSSSPSPDTTGLPPPTFVGQQRGMSPAGYRGPSPMGQRGVSPANSGRHMMGGPPPRGPGNFSRPGTAPGSQPGYPREPNPAYGPPRSAHSNHGPTYPPQQFRQQNNSSPWQRGAGYD